MSYRIKRDIQSSPLQSSVEMARGLFSSPLGFIGRIAKTLSRSDKRAVVVPVSVPAPCVESSDSPPRWIVFSDTENDVNSVNNTLRFAGILNKQDELTDNLEGVTIFHTGDLIDKKNPDPAVVEYWQLLQRDALTKGCTVKLIVGNHEQEIWQKIKAGEKFDVGEEVSQRISSFIEDLDLFHVAGSILFIHGYPTVEFLKALLHFKEVTGKDLNSYNTDHYKKALKSVKAIRQYAYVRDARRANYLLYDLVNASRYYKKKGRVVGAVLEQLKIKTVIHGHRPQRSGMQVDYEFGKWIPNVRMIGNDTMVTRTGIGATVIRATSSRDFNLGFINAKTASSELRTKVQLELSPANSYSSC